MSHEPEPIVIDRRHPAWVAAYSQHLRTLCEERHPEARHEAGLHSAVAIKLADDAWLQINAADNADRAAYEMWRQDKADARRSAMELLAVAMYQKHCCDLPEDMKDVVSYTLAQHGDDLQEALRSLSDDFDPLADVPCPSVTP